MPHRVRIDALDAGDLRQRQPDALVQERGALELAGVEARR
jgi:hypothetical protein